MNPLDFKLNYNPISGTAPTVSGLNLGNFGTTPTLNQDAKVQLQTGQIGLNSPTVQSALSHTAYPNQTTTTTVKTTPVNQGVATPSSGQITTVEQAKLAGAYDATHGAGSYNPNGGLPETGSPVHSALTSYAGTTVPSTTSNFSINPTGDSGAVPSTSLGGASTYNDVLSTRNDYEKKLLESYNDPAIVAARQQAADAQNQLLQAQKAARDETFNIQNGTIGLNRTQATDFSNQANLVNSQQVANYALAQGVSANNLGVLTAGQQNQIAGYGALLGANQTDIENQLKSIPGYLGTVQSPTGELFVQTRDPLTGQVKTESAANIYGGSGGSGQNLLQSAAQSLVDGTQSPSQIAASSLNPQLIYQMANQISMNTKGVPFNAQQAEANYSATKDALVQNSTQYRTLVNSQAAAVSHLDDLQAYFNQIPKTSYPAVNSVVNWFGKNLGSGALQSYQTALQTARGEVAKVLAGGGAASDADVKAANSTLPDNMSASQFQGAIAATKLLMQQKIAEYTSTSNVPQYGSSSATGSGITNTKGQVVSASF